MQALLPLAVLGAMLWLAGQVKQGFIPRVDSEMIFANIQYPEGIPFKELSKRQEQIAAVVQKHPAVEGVPAEVALEFTGAAQKFKESTVLPVAGFGALLVLLMDEEFNILSFVGIILLVGLVKKNSIIMVDFALTRQRAAHWASPWSAACCSRGFWRSTSRRLSM